MSDITKRGNGICKLTSRGPDFDNDFSFTWGRDAASDFDEGFSCLDDLESILKIHLDNIALNKSRRK